MPPPPAEPGESEPGKALLAAPVPGDGFVPLESFSAPEARVRSDLTLDEAFVLAERSHPEISVALARLAAAKGIRMDAGRYPNPRATLLAPTTARVGRGIEDRSLCGKSDAFDRDKQGRVN